MAPIDMKNHPIDVYNVFLDSRSETELFEIKGQVFRSAIEMRDHTECSI